MPLTPNGKVDKNVLPFPDTALAAANLPVVSSKDELNATHISLRQVWSTLLGINEAQISLKSNFFDVGGHSIMATRLVFAVRKTFACEAPLGMVYKCPTLQQMAHEINFLRGEDLNLSSAMTDDQVEHHKRAKSYEKSAPINEEFDYASDLTVVDEDSISNAGLAEVIPSQIFASGRDVTFFLTGVTGFLGAFILQSIFKTHPSAIVWCLVRASSDEKGHARVIENCRRHLIPTDGWAERIHACAGDLASPLFNQSAEHWKYLCESVDIIIHNGALVHWIYPYQKLRGPNVIGTRTALQLATKHHLKPLHFVSSTSVLDTEHYIRKIGVGSVMESDDLQGSSKGLSSGYGQTKWVAEQLILRARSRGVPATIIRPGYIVGDTQTGVTNTDDFIWRLVKGSLQLGKVPRISNVVNMCSVDYVANCVVQVATSDASISLGVFHTWNSFKYH